MRTSSRISSPPALISTLTPLHGLCDVFQSAQPRAPERVDVLGQFAEALSLYHIKPLGAHPAFGEQAGVAQNRYVLRDRWPRQLKAPSNDASRHLPLANEVDDLKAGLIA